ncbi:MAG: serine/threonine-protein kinase [Myxococcaceae bacterium]|nr:serine/threonine-protein kinase [Myxococcaceae bacterium]
MSHPLTLVTSDGPAPPLAFGPYGVEGVLGRGTMGLVYRARHQTLGRPVAIKCLHESLISDTMLVKRFLQEAKLVNAINHPHIVEVYDFVESPGQVYAVMELLEGETLTSRLERQALSLTTIVRVATQLGEALKAAHALSVVHRDLKPDNVFLCQREGRDWVKVLDFGVAKLVSTEGPRVVETQNGDVLGTPRYMAPEQAAGLDVDARTDVYAFGTLLFELLAGKPPFESTVYGQLAADIITRPPPPVPTLTRTGDAVPEGLRQLVAACLAKQPDHRPPGMDEVLYRLAHLDEALPPLELRAPRRWPLVAGALGLAVALVTAGLVAGRDDTPEPRETSPAPLVATPTPSTPPPGPTVPTTIHLALLTAPPGASVIDTDSGALLGTTPLTLDRPVGEGVVSVRFEMKGYEPLSRQFPTTESVRVELPLKRQPVAGTATPKRTRVVTDGVLDPF